MNLFLANCRSGLLPCQTKNFAPAAQLFILWCAKVEKNIIQNNFSSGSIFRLYLILQTELRVKNRSLQNQDDCTVAV